MLPQFKIQKEKRTMDEKIGWKEWVLDVGIRNCSKIIGVHYESVRRWVSVGGGISHRNQQLILKANPKIDPASFFK
ncbi:hypothetical protein DRJ25_04940 [Candidatus Woesearchaeota archaeon]|nr:MAG: hypothetical protein DRJ25_04940 [Candidatus Woesearchaeota archaeon]